jgi:hypothetical protein
LALTGDGWAQQSFEDLLVDESASASGDQPGKFAASPQVVPGLVAEHQESGSAELHTTHPPAVDLSSVTAADLYCFSGSAVSGKDRQRQRAVAREDQLPTTHSANPLIGADASPLRGEKRTTPQPTGLGAATSTFEPAAAVPVDLSHVLTPIAHLWAPTQRVSTGRWLANAVRRELARLRGLVGAQRADQALTARLERRIAMQGPLAVESLQGWLLGRGLPQRAGCWSHLCDDGVRMDTGLGCDSCACLVEDQRALRRSVAATVAAQHPSLAAEERRAEVERRLRERLAHEATMDLARRERSAQKHVELLEAIDRQRKAVAATEAARAARPCEDCSIADAGGLCLACSTRRGTAALVKQAVDITVALRAELDDQKALTELTERVERDTWNVLMTACAGEDADDTASEAYTERLVAEKLLAQRRSAALTHLRSTKLAEAEAEHAHWMTMRQGSTYPSRQKALEAAAAAGEKARARVAEQLLSDFLRDLLQARSSTAPVRRPWRERCAELAARPPSGEAGAVPLSGPTSVTAAFLQVSDPAHLRCAPGAW